MRCQPGWPWSGHISLIGFVYSPAHAMTGGHDPFGAVDVTVQHWSKNGF